MHNTELWAPASSCNAVPSIPARHADATRPSARADRALCLTSNNITYAAMARPGLLAVLPAAWEGEQPPAWGRIPWGFGR